MTDTHTNKEKVLIYCPFLGFDINHHTKDQGGLAESFGNLGYDTTLILGSLLGIYSPLSYKIIETGNVGKGKELKGTLREFFFVLHFFLNSDYTLLLMLNYNRLIPVIALLLRIKSLFSNKRKKMILRLDWDGILRGSPTYKLLYTLSIIIDAILFDKIITETTCSFHEISKKLVRLKNKLALVPVGVKSKNQLSKTIREKTILCVARYVTVKGIDVLLKAFSMVHAVEPDWKLKVIGRIDDKLYFEELSDFVNKEKLTGCVELCGDLDDDELEFSYRQSSIFALLSYSESFGLSRAEASYYGLPVVTTVAGCGSTYGNKIIPYGDCKAAADRILELIRNPNISTETARAQRNNVKTWDEVAQMLLRLIRE